MAPFRFSFYKHAFQVFNTVPSMMARLGIAIITETKFLLVINAAPFESNLIADFSNIPFCLHTIPMIIFTTAKIQTLQ